ncbi:hypothetical protein STENM327S_06164 [Streptomyces tendae]
MRWAAGGSGSSSTGSPAWVTCRAPGGPRTVTDEQVAAVVKRTLESTPKNATHWSTPAMAQEIGPVAVDRVTDLAGARPAAAPHETFKLSTDPYFIDKVHDVVGLYQRPERALVFCVDEKSQIQALDRSQPVLPMMPGVPQRLTHDYVRAGTTTLFAALEVATGKVIGSLHRRHRAEEFKKFLIKLDQAIPADLDVHLVLDNYAAQDPGDQDLAGSSSPLPPALHAHRIVLAQSGGTLVCRADEQADTTRGPQERPGAGEGHPRLDRRVEHRPGPTSGPRPQDRGERLAEL